MPREIITIQVGQCGNQIGRQFWNLVLNEHAYYNKDGIYDESMSTFFRNVDTRYDDLPDIPFGNGNKDIKSLRARAILVDMDEATVNESMNGPLGEIFDNKQFITDVSGAGNNFAHGHEIYGPQYRESILESIQRAVQFCDSLQAFFIIHSMGGGTGSGLGTYILKLCKEEYPDIYRFTTAVFPSDDDDVITSPYNSVLALQMLTENADCVLPIENQSLINIIDRLKTPDNNNNNNNNNSSNKENSSSLQLPAVCKVKKSNNKKQNKKNGYDAMNNIVANLLSNLTSSMRFAGELNVDLNEIVTNLVPYPRLHYLTSSLTSTFNNNHNNNNNNNHNNHSNSNRTTMNHNTDKKNICISNRESLYTKRKMKGLFNEAFSPDNQLMRVDQRKGTVLACGLFFRGRDISISDVNTNIIKLQSELKMVYWNREGFKVGICSQPSLNMKMNKEIPIPSLLCLSNNCCIADTFEHMHKRFMRLYSRKAMIHHYTEFTTIERFQDANESLLQLISDYRSLDKTEPPIGTEVIKRWKPLF